MKGIVQLTVLSTFGLLLMQSCKSDESDTKLPEQPGADGDTDADTDADTGTDADTDTDVDADSDADTDSDADPATCPDTLPADGDVCDDMSLRGCVFGDVTCDCRWSGGGGASAWSCETSCPAAAPATGDPCDESQYSPCDFAPETCLCETTDDTTWTWTCDVVATECPAQQPAEGGMCDATAIDNAAPEGCAYGDVTCDCARWTSSWSCEQQCPATQPTTGGACSEVQASPCVFDPEICTCETVDDATWTWSCAAPATTCPDAQPTEDTLCDREALDTAAPDGCVYGDLVCSCSRWTGTFRCEMGCPAAAPAAGDPCTEGQASPCNYAESDQICTCDVQTLTWTCEAAAGSCPESQPEDEDPCIPEAIQAAGNCTYDAVECFCNRRNGFNCMESPDLDASVPDQDASVPDQDASVPDLDAGK